MRSRTPLRFVALAFLVAAVGAGCSTAPAPTPEPTDGGIDGVQTFGDLTRDHTTDDFSYPQSPPVGGDHDRTWMDCTGTVYDEPVRNEKAVHSMEHGAVWVTYTDAASQGDIDAMAAKVEGQPYSLMSPYPDQESPIVLSAWGVQLGVESAADPRVDLPFGPSDPRAGCHL
jgi:hypothetical protein